MKCKIEYSDGNIIEKESWTEIFCAADIINASSGSFCKYFFDGKKISFSMAMEAYISEVFKNASSGNSAKNASSGYYAQNASSGDYAKNASSGYYAKNIITGKNSVCFDCGIGGVISGVKGAYIALAEYAYKEDKFVCIGVKSGIIDGKKLKENTFYGIYSGEFTEIDFTDEIKTAVVSNKGKIKKLKKINDKNEITDEIIYAVSDGQNWAHGETVKNAKENLRYKISNRDKSKYKDLKLTDKVSFEEAVKMYRVITGACEYGCKQFVELHIQTIQTKYSVEEIINLTKGCWGNDELKKFFEVKK
jgi:hypothetical protein